MECLSVSQANTLARQVLEEYSIWIKGEVYDAKPDKYYYRYFCLKDEDAVINCVIASAKLKSADFAFEEGISVKAFGTLSIYEKRGDFQFKIELIQKDGEGNIQAKIEEIKQRLQKEGLLDESRKKKLPAIPKKIAVITSAESAAWKDFYKIINARYPNLEIILYDVLVQGDKAAGEVTKALQYINTNIQDLDLIVITRGGGSLEDLMAFNDESLARAIAMSNYPVVSAIGHEKDTSISDLVADLRASTPSNAAELITPDLGTLHQVLDTFYAKMIKWVESQLSINTLNLSSIVDRSELTDKAKFIKKFTDQLDYMGNRIAAKGSIYEKYGHNLIDMKQKIELNMKTKVADMDKELIEMYEKLKCAGEDMIQENTRVIENIEIKIDLNNPLQILKKGYSIVTDSEGKIVKSISHAKKGGEIKTKLADGMISSIISNIQPS